jgi:D-3-phosphoglycerate dehydrogenase / 2-oxoglutarate reductase
MLNTQRRFKVVLTDPRWADLQCEEKHLTDIADLNRFYCQSEEELILNCADADALLVTYAPITRRVIGSLKKCQVISVYAIGLDMVDVQAATEVGIRVTNVPEYCIEEVCDHAMALLLTAARKILVYHQSIVQDEQWNCRVAQPIYRVKGRTLGLIGFGKIPRAVTVRAMSFGLRVMAFDPYVAEADFDKAGVVKAELDDLLRQADFISIHAPLTSETKGLIDLDRFRLMKPNAVIISTSRGQIIEEKALVKALNEGWIAGAALDVLEIEPPVKDNPLMHMKNVILTPHAGFFSEEAVEELRSTAAKNVRSVLTGQEPAHLVNPGVLK